MDMHIFDVGDFVYDKNANKLEANYTKLMETVDEDNKVWCGGAGYEQIIQIRSNKDPDAVYTFVWDNELSQRMLPGYSLCYAFKFSPHKLAAGWFPKSLTD